MFYHFTVQDIANISYVSYFAFRYNAEKKKVGMYYTTPIYLFRMKCHLCDNHFEIKVSETHINQIEKS